MKTPAEDDECSAEGIRWVYDLDVVYKKDLARFWEAVANLDRRGYYYPRSKNGLYIIESGNKMFFTDGDYRNPSVESVIWFDDAFETNLAELKEWIYNEERTFGRHDESLGLIEDVCGYGHVREFRKEVYRSNERETERRKGANRKGHTGGSEGGERYSLKGSDDYNLRKLQAETRYSGNGRTAVRARPSGPNKLRHIIL